MRASLGVAVIGAHRIVQGAGAQMDLKLSLSADASLQDWSLSERVWNLPKVRLEWIALILALEQIRQVRLVNGVNRPLVPSRKAASATLLAPRDENRGRLSDQHEKSLFYPLAAPCIH
jgi:hypothetical protein